MRKMNTNPFVRLACWYLVMALAGVFTVPAIAHAAFIPSTDKYIDGSVDELKELRKSLEDELLRERLLSLGLSADEVAERIDALTWEERQAVMADLERIQAGGDTLGTLLGIALIVLIVVLILKVLDKEIIIK